MKAYNDIVTKILNQGVMKGNRTGVDTLAIAGAMFEHDMALGFPILTTKKMGIKTVCRELEFFIKGITDKKWLEDRKCYIWSDWANPEMVPYGHDEETKAKMKAERDLGAVYGWQWRNFGATYCGFEANYEGEGYDQFDAMIQKLKTDPSDRRMIVSAWNPLDLKRQALPPCHLLFQVTVINGKLNLLWFQRSVDTALGLPFNIASYAMLLKLIAKESDLQEGMLCGFLGDVHIYENHIEKLTQQIARTPYQLPTVDPGEFSSIYDWSAETVTIHNYQCHEPVEYEIAV